MNWEVKKVSTSHNLWGTRSLRLCPVSVLCHDASISTTYTPRACDHLDRARNEIPMSTTTLAVVEPPKKGKVILRGYVSPTTLEFIQKIKCPACNYEALMAHARRLGMERAVTAPEYSAQKWRGISEKDDDEIRTLLKEKHNSDVSAVPVTEETVYSPDTHREFLKLERDTPSGRSLLVGPNVSTRRKRSLMDSLSKGKFTDAEIDDFNTKERRKKPKPSDGDDSVMEEQPQSPQLQLLLTSTVEPKADEGHVAMTRAEMESLLAEQVQAVMETTAALTCAPLPPRSTENVSVLWKTASDDDEPVNMNRFRDQIHRRLFLKSVQKMCKHIESNARGLKTPRKEGAKRESMKAEKRSFQAQLGQHASSQACRNPDATYMIIQTDDSKYYLQTPESLPHVTQMIHSMGKLEDAKMHPVQQIKERPSMRDPVIRDVLFKDLKPIHEWLNEIRSDKSAKVPSHIPFPTCTEYETSITLTVSYEDGMNEHIYLHGDRNKKKTKAWSVSVFEDARDAYTSGLYFTDTRTGQRMYTGEGAAETDFTEKEHGVSAPVYGKRYSLSYYLNDETITAAECAHRGCFLFEPEQKTKKERFKAQFVSLKKDMLADNYKSDVEDYESDA